MKNYRKIKIGDVLDIKRGMSLAGEYYATEGKYIRLTLGNFNYPECGWKDNITKENLYYSGPVRNEFLLKKGDIITPLTEQVRGLLGNTARIPKNNIYIQSGDIGLVIPDETKINRNFAYYLISSRVVKRQLDAGSQQTKIRHTCPEAIKDCVAFLPELSQQQKIATILDFIENKIQNNIKINNNLQQVATTLYDFLFAKKQPNGKLSDILLENEKSTIQVGSSDNICGNYPFFTSGETINEWQDYFVDGINCYLSTGGNASIKVYAGKAAYSTDTWCIYGKENYSSYLYFYLKSIIKSINSSYFAGSGLKHLQKDALLNIDLYIPTKDEIETFNKIANPILIQASQLFTESKKLIKQRDFLLPLLMNGQATIDE